MAKVKPAQVSALEVAVRSEDFRALRLADHALRSVDTRSLIPDPKNPRGAISPESVQGLAESIRAVGMVQPIIVIDSGSGDGYFVLAGHRRLSAARLIGLAEVPVLIVDGNRPEDAGAITVIENEQRLAIDPIRSAAAVEQLLAKPGATVAGVAAVLGFPRRWVALRAQLAKLSPKARKCMEPGHVLSSWPVEWLCEFAVLSQATQDDLLAGNQWRLDDVRYITDVRALVQGETRPLSAAPWDLADPKLYAKAGACLTCPKNSAASPYLFEVAPTPPPEGGMCRDGTCWARKLNAWRGVAVQAKRGELGEKLICTDTFGKSRGMTGHEQQSIEKAIGQPLTSRFGLKLVKRGTPRAVPVMSVSGSDAGTVKWAVKDKSSLREQVTGRNGKPKARSVADLRERLTLRRRAHAVSAVAARVEAMKTEDVRDDDQLLELVAAFGCDAVEERATKGKSQAWHALHLAAIPRRAQLVEMVLRRIMHSTFQQWMRRSDQAALVARDLCDLLGWKWDGYIAAAVVACPEPKSWGAKYALAVKKKPRRKAQTKERT